MFLKADIPPNKLNHPTFYFSLVSMRKSLPSKTPTRASVVHLASHKENFFKAKKFFDCE